MINIELFEQAEQSVISQAVEKYMGTKLTGDNMSQVNRVYQTTSGKNTYTLSYNGQSLGVVKYDISKENCNIVFEPNIENYEGELLRI